MCYKNIFLSVGVAAGWLISSTANAVSLYQLTDLGQLSITSNEEQNLRIKINGDGQIVGWAHRNNVNSNMSGFQGDGISPVTQPLSISAKHQFQAINSSQQVAGFIENNNIENATLWSNNFGTSQTLPGLAGDSSRANGVNDAGVVVGKSKNANQKDQAVSWTSGAINVVINDSSINSSAEDINQNGWIAGDAGAQAFVFDKSTVKKLNQVDSNIYFSWASRINNLNQVVGGLQYINNEATFNPYSPSTAYLWDSVNGVENIGANIEFVSWANGINNSSQVVGGRKNKSLSRQALLWENGVAYNLNELAQNNQNFELRDATDINDSGVIVGIARKIEQVVLPGTTPRYHVVLLTPAVSGVAAADLSIKIAKATVNGKPGARNLTLDTAQQISLEIYNQGPADASNVIVETETNLPLTQSDIISTDAVCSINGTILHCEIDQLVAQAGANVTIQLANAPAGEFDLNASISAAETDAGPNENNTVSEKIVLSKSESVPVVSEPAGVDDGDNSTPVEEKGTDPVESVKDSKLVQNAKAKASGCTLNNSQDIDPTLWLLCIVAILYLRKRSVISQSS